MATEFPLTQEARPDPVTQAAELRADHVRECLNCTRWFSGRAEVRERCPMGEFYSRLLAVALAFRDLTAAAARLETDDPTGPDATQAAHHFRDCPTCTHWGSL